MSSSVDVPAHSGPCSRGPTPRRNRKPGGGRWIKAAAIGATAVALATSAVVGTVAAQTLQLFDDVPRGHYAYDAIQWAVENGITEGCGDGRNFCPEQPLDRAHMVTFLKRYHDKFGSGASSDAGASPGGASPGADPDTSETRNEYMLDGWGSDEESVSLPAGRYSVSFALVYDDRDRNLNDEFASVTLKVEDSNGRTRTLVDSTRGDLSSNATRTFADRASFEVGTRLGQLDPGRIYLAVELAIKSGQPSRASWAEWEIVVSER